MSLARSYAKALFESAVAKGNGAGAATTLDAIESQLDTWTTVIETSKVLRAALTGPVSSAREKEAIVTELCSKLKTTELLMRFLVLTARKNRLAFLSEIRTSLTAVRLEAEGGMPGRVISADPLAPADVQALEQSFGKKLGHKVAFRADVDAKLLAGMKITVGGVTYDGSLQTQIERLRDRLVYAQS